MQAVGQTRDERRSRHDAPAGEPQPLELSGFGDVRRAPVEDEPERRVQAVGDDAGAPPVDDDQAADILGRVEAAAGAPRERGRMRQPAGDDRYAIAGGDVDSRRGGGRTT